LWKGEGWLDKNVGGLGYFFSLNLIFTISFEIGFLWRDKDSLKFGELGD
jgi:hypothetical protein